MPFTPSSQENGHRKVVKGNPRYVCVACEEPQDSFSVICPDCLADDTLVPLHQDREFDIEDEKPKRKRARKITAVSSELPKRISTGRPAWDIVLGGGLVRPSSVLVAGGAGVGKTSTLLRVLNHMGESTRRPVLYGSAEMPAEMVKHYVSRLRLSAAYLYINDSKQAEDMHEDILELRPIAIVWDSIQRFRVSGSLGEVVLKDVVTGAIESGEHVKAVSFLISHVTKQNEDFMGPNDIGHDVDAVVYIQKAGDNLVTIETRTKNRWGPTPLTATENLV